MLGTGSAPQARQLIRRCLAGDRQAIGEFQQTYGELVYGFPMRAFRVPAEDAGDFYVFAFDNGRIFSRLRTFEGRIPLRAYLLGSVLDNLVLEWKRGQREIDTVPMDAVNEPAAPVGGLLPNGEDAVGADRHMLDGFLQSIEPSKRVLLKLLNIEDHELTAPEIRQLAETTGRSIPDLLAAVEQLRATVREREARLREIEDALEGVHAWIQLYERRLRRIAEDLRTMPPEAAARLRHEQAELERKIQWRREQRTTLLARAQRRKVTAPYKDLAALLNTTVGNVASQIARLRKYLRDAQRTIRIE
jgi:RNA polymerase sigma factor (sigma-70 family)